MKLENRSNISALVHAGKEPCIYWEERGFGCRVYKSGRKTWVLGYRAGGRKRLVTIGEFPAISYLKARDLAAAYRLQIEEGIDPLVDTQQPPQKASVAGVTQSKASVGSLCDAYVELHAKQNKSGAGDIRLIDRYVRPLWGKLRADKLTRQQIVLQHAAMSKKAPVLANRLLALLKTLMNKAALWGFVPDNHANPAMRVPMNKEISRERFVSEVELPRLISAVEMESNVYVRGVLWLYLLTGARKSELLHARWDDVDLNRAELRVPAPKQGKPHVYPLTARAIEVLKGLPRARDSAFVFPGLRPGAHLVNISKPWDRVRTRAKLTDVHLHDLRRSVGSWLAESGFSLISIGKVLGHKSQRTTQIYARLSDNAARKALESHSERMMNVLHNSQHVETDDSPTSIAISF